MHMTAEAPVRAAAAADGRTEIHAFRLDGAGGGLEIAPPQASDRPAKGFDWIVMRADLDVEEEEAAIRLADGLDGLDELVRGALLADETRPRCTLHGAGVLLNLRGVTYHPGAEPEDLASLRVWIEPGRIVSLYRRNLAPLEEIVARVRAGRGPRSEGDLVVEIAFRLTGQIEPVIDDLSEAIDALEETADDCPIAPARRELGELRHSAIELRRFVAPQREALTALTIEEIDWLEPRHLSRLREAADRVTRAAEELDAVRERAAVLHDQLSDRRAEQVNQQTLVLTIAAATFLPLTFLTGLLGMNVGGIPGAAAPTAFWLTAALCLALALGQLWFFRRKGWF